MFKVSRTEILLCWYGYWYECWTYARSNQSAECRKLQAGPFLVSHPGPSMQKPLVVMIKVRIESTARYKSSLKNDQLCKQSNYSKQRTSKGSTYIPHKDVCACLWNIVQHRTHILLLNLHFKASARGRDFSQKTGWRNKPEQSRIHVTVLLSTGSLDGGL